MMRALAERGFDRSSARGIVRWAAALLAHNLLLRGGEVGVVEGKAFDTSQDLVVGAPSSSRDRAQRATATRG